MHVPSVLSLPQAVEGSQIKKVQVEMDDCARPWPGFFILYYVIFYYIMLSKIV